MPMPRPASATTWAYLAAFGYWMACCLACLACLMLIKATLGQFIAAFGDGSTAWRSPARALMLWAVHALVLRGVKQAAALNTIATVAKTVPIGIFVVVVIFAFRSELFALNLWGGEAPGLSTRGAPGARHDAADGVRLRRHRRRERLFALCQGPQRRRHRHGAGLPGRAVPADAGDAAVLRHPAARRAGRACPTRRWPACWRPSSAPGGACSSASG